MSQSNPLSPAGLRSILPQAALRSEPQPPAADAITASEAAPRALLVGTALSVKQLHHMLAVTEPRPYVVGCLLPEVAALAFDGASAVLGTFAALDETIEKHDIELVLLSLPTAMGPVARRISQQLERCNTAWRFLPTFADQLAGRSIGKFGRPASAPSSFRLAGNAHTIDGIDPAWLINRAPRPLDEPAIQNTIAGKTVMITGGGGSIGSELARIAARFSPERLIILERSENALFEIDRHLREAFPKLPRLSVLHDVTQATRTLNLLERHPPDIIFHAAAHKHVPVMEDHPADAVENNLYGTRSIADAADHVNAERFVMISTDKAVNPSSIMGASKRLAELYIRDLSRRSRTTYSMVRFGNVLGSACSVLPIWSRQIAQGKPVTVTHPDMQRYFMTIPEAAGLVIQSAAYSRPDARGSGEVFLLDMGDPVKILDLAQRFITAQGLEPDVDVPIVFTGVRPGEKMFESLAYDDEQMSPTPHAAIHRWHDGAPDTARIRQVLKTLDRLRSGHRQLGSADGGPWHNVTRDAVLNAIHAAVPEMVSAAAG